jgi:hypothetical protein
VSFTLALRQDKENATEVKSKFGEEFCIIIFVVVVVVVVVVVCLFVCLLLLLLFGEGGPNSHVWP